MKYGYIGTISSAKDFQEYIELFGERGVAIENVVVNHDFNEFAESLKQGDEIIVGSYVGLFVSLGAYLTRATELIENGIMIESILEPNIVVTRENSELIRELIQLNHRLRSTSSIKSINRLKDEDRRVGRPRGSTTEMINKVIKVDKLCNRSGVSIVEACKIAGCQPRTYYRIKNKEINN